MLSLKNRLMAALCFGLLYLAGGSIATGGTLLPNGMQYFTDNNGLPLSSGCIYFFIPGTTTPKATYQDSGQTIANTNPVQLDAAGRAIIYGTGTYRQIVKATGGGISPCSPAGVTIWDQLTASTDSSATIFAGASAGTPNAITVNAPAFSGTDGQVINYISTNTNTAAATLNPSGFGAVPVVRDSATGPGALTGGELVATNAVSVIYDATAGTFHILSPVTWPNTSGVPVGTIIPVSGFTAPTNYAFAYGQAVSRTTFAILFSAITLTQTGSISSGSPTITGLTDTSQLGYGMPVESVGISGGTTILKCDSTTCTMSANATTTRSGGITFFAYGNGDGSTTFNLPDYRGLGMVGRDNMGGTAGNNLQVSTTISTTNLSTSATVLSASGLAVGMFVISTNVPANTTITAISGTTLTLSNAATGTAGGTAARFSQFNDAQTLAAKAGSPTQTLNLGNLPTGITAANAAQSITVNTSGTENFPTTTGATWAGPVTVGSGAPVTGQAPSMTNPVINRTSLTANNSISVTSNNTLGLPTPITTPRRTINFAVRLSP